MNYKYGNKNNWRRWLWNTIDKLINCPYKEPELYSNKIINQEIEIYGKKHIITSSDKKNMELMDSIINKKDYRLMEIYNHFTFNEMQEIKNQFSKVQEINSKMLKLHRYIFEMKNSHLVNKNKKDLTIMYLPGEQDIDRDIAKRKGFNVKNMIAVDRDTKVVSKFKNDKKLIIEGDIGDIIYNYKNSKKIDIIIADLYHGATFNLLKLIYQIITSNALNNESIIAFNLLRGRDNYIKSDFIKNLDVNVKHRGEIATGLFIRILNDFTNNLENICNIDNMIKDDSLDSAIVYNNISITKNAKYNSYKTINGLIYDSCVFVYKKTDKIINTNQLSLKDKYNVDLKNLYKKLNSSTITEEDKKIILKKIIEYENLGNKKFDFKNSKLKNHIAAIKAHITMGSYK